MSTRRIRKTLVLVILTIAIIFSVLSLPLVSIAAGDDFLGEWKYVKNVTKQCLAQEFLYIRKKGPMYLIHGEGGVYGHAGSTVPAFVDAAGEYKDGCIVANGPVTILFCKNTEAQLTVDVKGCNFIYKRVSDASEPPKTPPDLSWQNSPDSYKVNKLVDALIEKEGFKMGISKDEAMRLYGFDKIEEGIWMYRSDTLDAHKQTNEKAFRAKLSAPDGKVRMLIKTISVMEGEVNYDELQKMFYEKYGKEGWREERQVTGYFIKNNNRYLNVKIGFTTHTSSKPFVSRVYYFVDDVTDDVLKQIQVKPENPDKTRELKDKL
jgi:hypothetical protein